MCLYRIGSSCSSQFLHMQNSAFSLVAKYVHFLCSTFWSLSPTKLPNVEDIFQETNVQITNKYYTFPSWLNNKQAREAFQYKSFTETVIILS